MNEKLSALQREARRFSVPLLTGCSIRFKTCHFHILQICKLQSENVMFSNTGKESALEGVLSAEGVGT